MESFLIEAWVDEVHAELVDQRIFGVYIEEGPRIHLDFGRQGGRIYLQLEPQHMCFYRYVGRSQGAPKKGAPRSQGFIKIQSLLPNSTVVSWEKMAHDRIIRFYLDSGNVLVVELLPSAPNLILIDAQDTVIAMLNKDRNDRGLFVEAVYRAPTTAQCSTLTELALGRNELLEKWLAHNVRGMSPVLARELLYRCAGNPQSIVEAESEFQLEPNAPRIYSTKPLNQLDWRNLDPWRDLVVSPVRLLSLEGRFIEKFDSINSALLRFSGIVEESDQFVILRRSLRAAVKSRFAKQKRALLAAEQDCRNMADAEHFRICGELLLANIEDLKNTIGMSLSGEGETEVIIKNYYNLEGPPLRVRVDPRKTVQANAKVHFKRYRKAQRGYQLQTRRAATLRSAFKQTQSLLTTLEAVTDLGVLNRLTTSCLPGIKTRSKNPRRWETKSPPGQRLYHSSDGFVILVGQSAKQNEELTFKYSKGNDSWLHVSDYPGSHVIVRNPTRKALPRNTLIEAAQLAAYFSAARNEPKVEVRYTEQKNVQKVKGAAPGLVRLKRFKSLYVAPNRYIIKKQVTTGN